MKKQVLDAIQESCERLRDENSLIMFIRPEMLNELRITVTAEMLGMHINGVYVSLNKPFNSIDYLLQAAGLNTSSMYYVDCITTLVHPGKPDRSNPRVFHVGSPASIAEEGLLPHEIEEFISSVPSPKFIVVDTLRTLLIYNNPQTVKSFINHVIQTAEKMKSKLVVLTITHPDDKSIEGIPPLFDVITEIPE
jgi:hypothetical protein